MFRFHLSISNKLVLFFLTLSLFPLISLGIYSALSMSDALSRNTVMDLRGEVEEKGWKITGFLEDVTSDLKFISHSQSINNLLKGLKTKNAREIAYWRNTAVEDFKNFAETKGKYMQIRFLDAEGREVVRVDYDDSRGARIIPETALQFKGDNDYFKSPMGMERGEVFISPLNLNKEKGAVEVPYKPVIRYAMPIFDENGARGGVVVLNVLANQFLRPFQAVNSGRIFLVNQDGFFLAHPDPKREWGFMLGREDEKASVYFPGLGDRFLTGKEGVIQNADDTIYVFQRILPDPKDPNKFWTIVKATDKAVVLASVYRFRRDFLLFVLVVGMVLGVGAYLIGRRIARPVQDLLGVVREVAAGRGDLTHRFPVVSRDELGDLAKEFNRFLENLHDMVSSVAQTTLQVSSASDQLLAQSTIVVQAVDGQKDRTVQTAAAVEEISTTITHIAERTTHAAKTSEDVVNCAASSRDLIDKAIQGMNGASKTAAASAGIIRDLERSSQEIGAITAMIGEIADQTNLLALNASIEAARAGKQGMGFAVVAEEVKKLAERTTHATREINEMISKIRYNTQEASKITDKGMEDVSQGVGFIEDVGKSIGSILEMVKNMNDQIQQIATAVEEQSSVINEISGNLSGFTTAAEQSLVIVKETMEVSKTLGRHSFDLRNLFGRFKLS